MSILSRGYFGRLLLSGVLVLSLSCCWADDSTSTAPASKTPERRWSREWLEGRGIILQTSYRGETFSNLHGGLGEKRGVEYLGSADTTVELNLAKLKFGRGSIVVTGQSLHGRGINGGKVGAIQATSNLDNPTFNRLLEAYFIDTFRHRFTVKVGRQYADADFNVIENGADFLNASYGLIPTVPMPTYPAPTLGVSVWAKATSRISVGAGSYRGTKLVGPTDDSSPVSSGLFTIAETKITPFSKSAAFHGRYRFGVWQQTKSAWETNGSSAMSRNLPSRNLGFYGAGDHWFRKPSSAGENYGPGVFFQFGWSPSNRNQISRYWGGGVSYPGIVPQRSHDNVGIGVTQAHLRDGKNETVTEIFYKAQVTKRLFLQPDIQWVVRPGGDGRNAILGGIRVGVQF